MFSYDYPDFLQLQLNSDSSFDYDFDTHVAQCANVFGFDEKGLSDDHRHPLQMILPVPDGFGSSDSSNSSRSPSIAKDNIKAEFSDVETSSPPSPPSPLPMKNYERTRSFDESHTARRPVPSARPITHRSAISLTTLSISSSKPLEPEPPRSRKRIRKSRALQGHLYDGDADDESDNDTDDDYIPTPRSSGPKRRRISSQLLTHHSSLPNRPTSTSPVPQKHLSGSSLSRNRQATSATAIDQACSSSVNLNFVCPECGWKQMNKRLPDFKRHLRTHTRPDESDQSKGWWCKGVPLEDAHRFNIPRGAKSFEFLGQERIGGCRRSFSRRDALKRHLDNANVICVGRPCDATED